MTDNFDAMEFIWEKIPKTKEGLVQYLPGDLPYLYQNGFVDATHYTLKQWQSAFADCLQTDGSYIVSKEKFLSLRIYRYSGPVWKPFEPHRLREGEWTNEELEKLFQKAIAPSSSITSEIFWNSINTLRKAGCVSPAGNFKVTETVKKQLSSLIDRYPSPRRKLEIEVERLKEERTTQLSAQTEKRDASLFVVGKTSLEDKQENFKKLQSSYDAPPDLSDRNLPTIDIKSFKRPNQRIRS